jgi:hypothetical protein
MLRILAALVVLAATIVSSSAELVACGDKFLRVGRSARFRGYAAVHPASILIYRPANATPAGIKELESLLKRAGHKPLALEHGTALVQTLAVAHYDLVIAAYADAGKISEALAPLSSRPAVLPLLDKPTSAVAAEAEKVYPFLLKPYAMDKAQALAEIDRLMEGRLTGTNSAAK